MASERPQPDGCQMFIQDGARLVFELGKRVPREREARVPFDALADVAAGQPVGDVLAISAAEWRIAAEWIHRISAEEARSVTNGYETAQRFGFCGRKKEKTRPHPVLRAIRQHVDRFV